MNCDAAIRPMPDDTEIRCEVERAHLVHAGVLRDYAYPGSTTTITWHDTDRRNFHGEYPGRCKYADAPVYCILPNDHRGDCAS